MTLNSVFNITGEFEINLMPGPTYKFNNVITDQGKQIMLAHLQGEVAENPIFSIQTGTSGVTENPTDTDLLSNLATREFDDSVLGVQNIVFLTTFNYNESNDTIREVGIFCKDGTMFARKVPPEEITKTSSQLLLVRYRISVI